MLNVGIIGLGVGEQHIAGFNQTRNATVTHLCDLDHQKLQKLASKHGVKHSSVDSNDIIDDPNVDIVSIASYDDCHASQVVRAIDNSKHIFVEKPLCLFLEEAVQIAAALRERPNLKLSSNLILRCSPRFRDLKARISAGELGEVFAIDADYNYGRLEKLTDGWRGELDFYSVFLGGGVHMVDLVRWLTGVEVEEVFATGNQVSTSGSRFRHFDYVSALLRLSDGAQAKVSANFGCVLPHFHGLTVYGTKATFINDTPDARLVSSRDPDGVPEMIATAYPGCAKGDLIEGFLDEIMGEGSMEATAEEVFRTMAVCFAVEKSLSTGQPVEVDPILKLLL